MIQERLNVTTSQEPTPLTPAVRRFKDPHYQNRAPNLQVLRDQIDALDSQIVALMAERALCVRDATRFKKDALSSCAGQASASLSKSAKLGL